jgi:hypothetical protein
MLKISCHIEIHLYADFVKGTQDTPRVEWNCVTHLKLVTPRYIYVPFAQVNVYSWVVSTSLPWCFISKTDKQMSGELVFVNIVSLDPTSHKAQIEIIGFLYNDSAYQ